MLWGLGPEAWLQLWSGVIGSVVGAVGAALVALLVLRKTNNHQSTLARVALKEQRELADRELAAQRKDSKTALKEQRKALNKQLRDQRSEASRARELAAIADFLSAIEAISDGMGDPDWLKSNLSAAEQQLESARVRMTFEPHSRALVNALKLWVPAYNRALWIYKIATGEHRSRLAFPDEASEVSLDAVSMSAHMTLAASAGQTVTCTSDCAVSPIWRTNCPTSSDELTPSGMLRWRT